jgi:nucleoside-diphosphate-sugar epimerase
MQILMTGATGVIGRRAIPQLVGAGHTVTAAVRSEASAARVRQLGASPVRLDLFDAGAVGAAMRGVDVVINLATSIPGGNRVILPWAWKENSRIRRDASRIIAEAAVAAKVARYIQESFAPIYEDAADRSIDESSPVRTTSHTHSVLDAEAAVARYVSASNGGAGVVLRFGLFYGPDSDFTRDMLRGVKKGIAMAFGSPDGYQSSVSHDDAAAAVVAALGAPSGTYNIVDDEPVTRRVFYGALAGVVGAKEPRFPPAFLGRLMGSVGDILMRSQRISNRRFREATGWTPVYPSIREGAATLSG